MCKDFRKEGMNDLKGTRQHFIGKIKRRGGYERDGVRPFIIAPLFIRKNGEWVFVDHVWTNLPDEFIEKQGQVIEFSGTIYTYKTEKGEKRAGINFIELCKAEDSARDIEVPKMDFPEASLESKRKRYVANRNISIIAAYENGEDLSVSTKGDMKKFIKKVKLAQARGKHGWACNY